jgi:prevent-host-death family protein
MVKVNTVPASEVKTRLGEYLASVENGREEYIITKYDRPIARIVPVSRGNGRAEALRRLDAIPARKKSDSLSVKQLINMGRK